MIDTFAYCHGFQCVGTTTVIAARLNVSHVGVHLRFFERTCEP